VTDLRESLVLR